LNCETKGAPGLHPPNGPNPPTQDSNDPENRTGAVIENAVPDVGRAKFDPAIVTTPNRNIEVPLTLPLFSLSPITRSGLQELPPGANVRQELQLSVPPMLMPLPLEKLNVVSKDPIFMLERTTDPEFIL
jgi:hypothetical protein